MHKYIDKELPSQTKLYEREKILRQTTNIIKKGGKKLWVENKIQDKLN